MVQRDEPLDNLCVWISSEVIVGRGIISEKRLKKNPALWSTANHRKNHYLKTGEITILRYISTCQSLRRLTMLKEKGLAQSKLWNSYTQLQRSACQDRLTVADY